MKTYNHNLLHSVYKTGVTIAFLHHLSLGESGVLQGSVSESLKFIINAPFQDEQTLGNGLVLTAMQTSHSSITPSSTILHLKNNSHFPENRKVHNLVVLPCIEAIFIWIDHAAQ